MIPVGVAVGLTLASFGFMLLFRWLGISQITHIFYFIPPVLFLLAGLLLMAVWIPVFISGLVSLGRRGAVGESARLKTQGIYHYVRHPMYSGVGFALLGIGLWLDQTGVALVGLAWFAVIWPRCRLEEKLLLNRFGQTYQVYRNRTPMFVPNFQMMLQDQIHRKVRRTRT